MKFGFFDDEKREYAITTPQTPYPWINYLGSEKFFSLISNTAGGYAFYTDARLRRLTRYRYNNIPLDNNGRYFFIKDGDTIWNPGWQPTQTQLDKYECRHGFGYTKFASEKNGIAADVLYMVPVHENCEVEQITLTNKSSSEKKISLVSFVEWCLYNASDDCQNFQRNFSTGEVEIEGSAIYHKTEYRERRNHFTFYSCNQKIDGFDTDRETFLGLYNNLGQAKTVVEGKSGNSVADGWSPIASHRLEITLKAGESKTAIFVLGYIENDDAKKFLSDADKEAALKAGLLRTNTASGVINKEKAYELQKKFDTPEKVAKAFDDLRAFWDETLSHFTLKSGDEKLDRMAVWNQYQCVVTYNFARSASYFESGIGRGLGFRDTSQDMLGAAHQLPAQSAETPTSVPTSTTTRFGLSLAWATTSAKPATLTSLKLTFPLTTARPTRPRCSSTLSALTTTFPTTWDRTDFRSSDAPTGTTALTSTASQQTPTTRSRLAPTRKERTPSL